MSLYCFTIDDNILFLQDLQKEGIESLFDHPYTAMLKRLHERFDLKIQLNLFYETEGFCLADLSDRYRDDFAACADWLKLSFHSKTNHPPHPYATSEYAEVYADGEAVQRQILRFAGAASLAATTTVHYCSTTRAGAAALADLGVRGLLGLFGSDGTPRTSYSLPEELGARLRRGEILSTEGVAYASLDLVVNCFKKEELLPTLRAILPRDTLRIMIHEQYFREELHYFQPDFEEKLVTVFSYLEGLGFQSRFFEEML